MQIRYETMTLTMHPTNNGSSSLSLAPCYVRKKQVQVVDQTTHPPKCHSFVGLDRQIGSSPPALFRKGEDGREKKREVLHLFRCYTHTLFARACAVKMHLNISEKLLYTEIYRNKCRPPEAGPTLCASLRSRNAHQHVTRATLYGNLQEKWRGPDGAP